MKKWQKIKKTFDLDNWENLYFGVFIVGGGFSIIGIVLFLLHFFIIGEICLVIGVFFMFWMIIYRYRHIEDEK